MKAMVLAAGLGTRLRPLTDTRPKALVELNARTLLEITLIRLRTFGVTEVIVNVHHFADMVVDYLTSRNKFCMRIEISREDDLLLDTGGGLKKAAWFFLEDPTRLDEPFFLHNVDVISNIDLGRMRQFHKEHQALATLAVQSRESSRLLLFNDQHQLCGRRAPGEETILPVVKEASKEGTALAVPKSAANREALAPEGTHSLHPFAFSGIHVISPRLLPMLSEEGVFSIIPSYLRLSGQGHKILAFRADQYYWRDLGRPADLAQAALDLEQKALL